MLFFEETCGSGGVLNACVTSLVQMKMEKKAL